ncbi:MAG TPA: SELO family protein, partial [Epsilonproteobacteria bacterium]|nr:SELO family protein [Campylobacterota bacterium]
MTLDNLTLHSPYLLLDSEFYDFTKPTPLEEPYLISFNPQAAKLIDLDAHTLDASQFTALLNGTFIPKQTQPYAMCYAGHQFG